MENNLKQDFITLNEVMENIKCLWADMTEEDREKCVESFFGLRNQADIMYFIQRFVPVKH